MRGLQQLCAVTLCRSGSHQGEAIPEVIQGCAAITQPRMRCAAAEPDLLHERAIIAPLRRLARPVASAARVPWVDCLRARFRQASN